MEQSFNTNKEGGGNFFLGNFQLFPLYQRQTTSNLYVNILDLGIFWRREEFFYGQDNDNDKVFYSTLIIHFIFNTAIDVFAY